MPMTLIEGHYEIVGAAPDGDSVKFYPAKKSDWEVVPDGSSAVRTNLRGGAQLRLDGIDALETHYAPKGSTLGTIHQPLDLANGAAKAAVDWLGFQNVDRDQNQRVTGATPARVRGHILTRFSDRYGRPVAFAFKGNYVGKSTGDKVSLTTENVKQSLNYHVLAQGLAYPTYYSKLYYDIRREMTRAVVAARAAGSNIWAKDRSLAGYTVPNSVPQFSDSAYIPPKLFRRMADYFGLGDGDTSVEGLKDYLAQLDDRIFILSEGQITGFDYVVQVMGSQVSLSKPMEDLVFQEK